MPQKNFSAAALLVACALPLAAQASSQSFVDQGCYNCHGLPKGKAPGIEQLSAELSGIKGDDAAQQRFYERFRRGERFERIGAHERVSPDSAKLLIRWLAEGAK